MVAESRHNPKTKDDVGYMDGQNGHNTNEVGEKIMADNGQQKNEI